MKYYAVLVYNAKGEYCSHHAIKLRDDQRIEDHKDDHDRAHEITKEDYESTPAFYRLSAVDRGTVDTPKTGNLVYVGQHKLGAFARYHYWQCVDCKTEYPQIDGVAKCNGHAIDKCPWCRPDSKQWTKGRGK